MNIRCWLGHDLRKVKCYKLLDFVRSTLEGHVPEDRIEAITVGVMRHFGWYEFSIHEKGEPDDYYDRRSREENTQKCLIWLKTCSACGEVVDERVNVTRYLSKMLNACRVAKQNEESGLLRL